MLLSRGMAVAQIPFEIFGGDKKTTIDLMFFRYFKKKNGTNSAVLFFNRNRTSIDYTMTTSSNLPQFGITEAISYNHPKWKGFAPVLVGQVFGSGMFLKSGIQFAYIKNELTLFTWLVSELEKEASFDYFFLGRYTPPLVKNLRLFSQVELVNTFPTAKSKNYSFTQRIRLGLKKKSYQWGIGVDLVALGRDNFATSQNTGIFLRHEF